MGDPGNVDPESCFVPEAGAQSEHRLLAADGVANDVIAENLGTSKPSVLKWRGRFEASGIEGLEEASGRGPKPTYGRAFVETVVSTTLRQPPAGVTHWSTRTTAEHLGTSRDTIH